MKNYFKQNYCLKGLAFLTVFALFLCTSNNSSAQSVKRQVISSIGSSGNAPGATIMQTVGQSYGTSSEGAPKSVVLQGFQQPVIYLAGKEESLSLQNLSLKVFPVPASEQFTLESVENLESISISITDLTGTEVYNTNLTNVNSHTVTCSDWVSGIYFITLTDQEQNSKTSKLMITK